MRMHNGENFALGRGNYEYLFAPTKKWLRAIPFPRGLSRWGRKMQMCGQEGYEQSPFEGEGEVRRDSERKKAYRNRRQRPQTSKHSILVT